MTHEGWSTRVAEQLDDYVEEVAVGTRWWVLVLAFGLGTPILGVLASAVFHLDYRPGSFVLWLVVGTLVGSGLALLARERQRYRAAAIDHTGDLAALRRKSWGEFEILVGEIFRRQGYRVKERGGLKCDRGIDLIAERGEARAIIQCKLWLSWSVREAEVKQLYADVKTQRFTEGWLVTSHGLKRTRSS